ncbi:MAG: hypothetical protein AAGG01_21230, partial [Planctomycetota bacterium]
FDLVFQDCALRGGRGGTAQAGLFSPPGGVGGTALQLKGRAQINLSSSSAVGGVGGFSTSGGLGGTGVLIRAATLSDVPTLFAYGSTIEGGEGGSTFDLFEGSGGDGLTMIGLSTEARLQACDVFGGVPGSGGFIPGEPGVPFSGSGTPTLVDGEPCDLVAPNHVTDGQAWEIQAEDVGAGGEASLLVAFRPAFRFAPAFERPLLVRWPAPDAQRYNAVNAGPLGATTYFFGPTPPPTGEDSLIVWTQMICTDANGASRFSAARAIVLLAAGL